LVVDLAGGAERAEGERHRPHPLGSHEQHGPHSAIDTDSHIAWDITRATERFYREMGRRARETKSNNKIFGKTFAT